MFLKLLKFDFIKSSHKNKLGLVVLALLILYGILFAFQHARATAYQTEYRNSLQADIERREYLIKELE